MTEGLIFWYRLKNYNLKSLTMVTKGTSFNPNTDKLMDYLNNAGKDNLRNMTD